MSWFSKYKNDFGFKSNYQVTQKTGITASSLTRLNMSKDWKSVKIGTMILLALAVDKTLDQFVLYLKEPDSE